MSLEDVFPPLNSGRRIILGVKSSNFQAVSSRGFSLIFCKAIEQQSRKRPFILGLITLTVLGGAAFKISVMVVSCINVHASDSLSSHVRLCSSSKVFCITDLSVGEARWLLTHLSCEDDRHVEDDEDVAKMAA